MTHCHTLIGHYTDYAYIVYTLVTHLLIIVHRFTCASHSLPTRHVWAYIQRPIQPATTAK